MFTRIVSLPERIPAGETRKHHTWAYVKVVEMFMDKKGIANLAPFTLRRRGGISGPGLPTPGLSSSR